MAAGLLSPGGVGFETRQGRRVVRTVRGAVMSFGGNDSDPDQIAGRPLRQSTAGKVSVAAFHARPLTEPDARQIAGWRYPPPYDFYDLPEDAWPDLLGLGQDFQAIDLSPGTILPPSRPELSRLHRWLPIAVRRPLLRFRSAAPTRRMSPQATAGFVCFGAEAQVIGARDAGLYRADALDIGLGLRPDLTGLGLGDAFFAACVDHARRTRTTGPLRLAVAAFNTRAITVYGRAGFVPIGRCLSPVRGRSVPFVVMVRS